jgi:hypothetical protein
MLNLGSTMFWQLFSPISCEKVVLFLRCNRWYDSKCFQSKIVYNLSSENIYKHSNIDPFYIISSFYTVQAEESIEVSSGKKLELVSLI